MNSIIQYIKSLFRRTEELDREAFYAYLHRLPENLSVAWTRDGDFIVGKITDDGTTYMTQAKSGDEFIEMVNDAVYTYHDIPSVYRDLIRQVRAYNPPAAELAKLKNMKITESSLSLSKQRNLAAA